MSNEEIKEIISSTLPSATYDETGEWLNVVIDSKDWEKIATECRNGVLQMDFLFCLTCIDWKSHLTMVYHLTSTKLRHNIVVKANLDPAIAEIESVCAIWRTAEFHEREVFEMFGVNFLNHPDLRKLILEDGFKGFPLRKDFEDPINMIKL
jgi:NADH-quinone oxidoreductase subunit C